MAIEVFSRYEKKFLLDHWTYLQVRDILQRYMELDAYNVGGAFYTICNLYYDTADDALIRRSLEKPDYKEKLRMRSYGVPAADGTVFLEIKKKVNGLVSKRRTAMRLDQAYHFLKTGKAPRLEPGMNEQVVQEIAYLLDKNQLQPKVYIAYDREAYIGREAGDLRISFDNAIRTRRDGLRMESGDAGSPLLETGTWLMEIKAEKTIPLWLAHMLSEYRIYSTSFSKYGTEYRRYMEAMKRKEREACWTFYSPLPQMQSLPYGVRS